MASEKIWEDIYEELVRIRELLERLARKELKEDLEKVATTEERKKIWALCDGMTSTADIATKSGVSQRAVQIFLNELQAKDLITFEKRGYPKRKYNYIPSEWKVT
jgi:predicted Rossmann fold nucleotide-binding protein DprA/Smf involved in DNA uptake